MNENTVLIAGQKLFIIVGNFCYIISCDHWVIFIYMPFPPLLAFGCAVTVGKQPLPGSQPSTSRASQGMFFLNPFIAYHMVLSNKQPSFNNNLFYTMLFDHFFPQIFVCPLSSMTLVERSRIHLHFSICEI